MNKRYYIFEIATPQITAAHSLTEEYVMDKIKQAWEGYETLMQAEKFLLEQINEGIIFTNKDYMIQPVYTHKHKP